MTDVTLVLIRIFLKILWFDRVAEFVSDLPDLAEPDFLIVRVVVGREILLDDRRHIAGGFLWEVVFNLKQVVEEIADVLDDLLHVDLRDVFFRHETRVCLAIRDELFGEALINRAAMALGVIAIVADIAVHRRTLVKLNVEEAQGVDDDFHRALHIAFVLGVLDSKEKFSTGLMCQPFVYERAAEIAELNEPGRIFPFQ